jgi:hypothetical protein
MGDSHDAGEVCSSNPSRRARREQWDVLPNGEKGHGPRKAKNGTNSRRSERK